MSKPAFKHSRITKALLVILSLLIFDIASCKSLNAQEQFDQLELSDYVTIVITVPETHADLLRDVMGRAGAGKVGNYSFCSFSVKGIGRFMPTAGSNPFQGKENILEEVSEERIETVCSLSVLDHVIEEIKKAHPYEETVIEIYPIFEIGRKKAHS